MCAGALVHARVATAGIRGARRSRRRGRQRVRYRAFSRDLNHRLEVTGGVLEADCRERCCRHFFAPGAGDPVDR